MRLRKGSFVPEGDRLIEGYQLEKKQIVANVDTDKLELMLKMFIEMHNEPLFFILELPTKQDDESEVQTGQVLAFHKDVYYIDGCTKENAHLVIEQVGDILFQDGFCSFGFGCHYSHDEIMIGKYNVVFVYSTELKKYQEFFNSLHIPQNDLITTAWDTFTPENPGVSYRVVTEGRDIFDIPELLKDMGIYRYERREQ
jgi:hypothetical protein